MEEIIIFIQVILFDVKFEDHVFIPTQTSTSKKF